jgi:hypothetical protein
VSHFKSAHEPWRKCHGDLHILLRFRLSKDALDAAIVTSVPMVMRKIRDPVEEGWPTYDETLVS